MKAQKELKLKREEEQKKKRKWISNMKRRD